MAKDNNGELLMGRHRKLYESFIFGKRINRLSWAAEAFYWRCYSIADDYGNFPVDPFILIAKAGGLRRMTAEETSGYIKEIESKGLIQLYLVGEDDWYGHLLSFIKTQFVTGPGGAPPKGLKREYPESPWDEADLDGKSLAYNSFASTKGVGTLFHPGGATGGVVREAHANDSNHTINTKNEKNTEKDKAKKEFVLESFVYWQETLDHPNAVLSPERIRILEARYRDSTMDEVKRAIDGCASSDFHMGRQPNNPTKYDDILLICRNRAKVEWFSNKVGDVSKKKDDKRRRQEEARRRMTGGK